MNAPERSQDRTPQAAEERALVEQLRKGEETAFTLMVRTYGPRMLAVAHRFMGHEQDAQDAVQDAFLSAFRGIDRFQSEAKLSTWLHRITVNAALMRLRSRRRRPERQINELLPKFLEDGHMAAVGGQWKISLVEAVENEEMREVVRRSIDDLPESYRVVLLLRDIEQRSTEETAELMDISVGAVKTRLHRARLALRTLLDPYMQGAA